jgi:hypothetical protein
MSIRHLVRPLVTATALVYLVVMVISGAMPEQRQLVHFEATGIMTIPPEQIERVEISRNGKTLELHRDGPSAWRSQQAGPLPQAVADKLSLAVQFMNTSGPVRVLEAAEHRATDRREFGLDSPQLSVVLSDSTHTVLRLHFGGLNPERFLQYMSADEHPPIYLMSLFVGRQWSDVAAEAWVKAAP